MGWKIKAAFLPGHEKEERPLRRESVDLICYSAHKAGPSERLMKVIDLFFTKDRSELCTTLDDLADALNKSSDSSTIVIINAWGRADLKKILALKDLLQDRKIILILPDREEKTIAQGHTLRPRLLSFKDSDFYEIAAVLTKMTSSGESRTNRMNIKDTREAR